jgi:hypothetical protein
MRGSKTIHYFITKAGTTYTGKIVWNHEPDLHKQPWRKEDEIIYRIELTTGQKAWVSNYEAKIKFGRNLNIYYELSEAGEQKIKKALGSAKEKHNLQTQSYE